MVPIAQIGCPGSMLLMIASRSGNTAGAAARVRTTV